MPLPPIKPKNPPSSNRGRSPPQTARGSKSAAASMNQSQSGRRPATRSKSIAPPKDAVPLVPTLTLAQAAVMDRDESQLREDIVRQEQLSYCSLTLHRMDAAQTDVFNVAGRVHMTVDELASATRRRDELVAQAESTLARSTDRAAALFDRLEGFMNHTQSDDMQRYRELERKCAALEHDLSAKTARVELLEAENGSLMNTLNRTLIKADMEHE